VGLTIKVVGAGQKYTKIAVYGKSGVGKTRLVGSSAQLGPTLIIRPPTDHTESIFGSGCEECVVQDWIQMEEMKEHLRSEGQKYQWVWLDSYSLWEEFGLDDVWEAAKAKNSARAQYGRDKGEYGITMQRMDEWLRAVVTVDKFNFGVTALPMLVLDTETGEEQWMPLTLGRDGKRSHLLCGYMNVVAYLGVKGKSEKVQRVLYTAMDEDHYAKDQYNAIKGGRLINPTMPKLMEHVKVARDAAIANNKPTRPARRRRRAAA
jgi:hypothetical protein